MKALSIEEMSISKSGMHPHNKCMLISTASLVVTALGLAVPGLALAYSIAGCFGLISSTVGVASCMM